MPSTLLAGNGHATLSRRCLRIRLWEHDRRCRYCRRSMPKRSATLDHVLPRARGGAGLRGNLVLCCVECNRFKDNKTIRELALWLARVALASLRVRMGKRGAR